APAPAFRRPPAPYRYRWQQYPAPRYVRRVIMPQKRSRSNISKLTVSQLRNCLRRRGICVHSKSKKASLIASAYRHKVKVCTKKGIRRGAKCKRKKRRRQGTRGGYAGDELY